MNTDQHGLERIRASGEADFIRVYLCSSVYVFLGNHYPRCAVGEHPTVELYVLLPTARETPR